MFTANNFMKKIFAVLCLISFFLILSPAKAQVTGYISECMDINESGSYVVTNDLVIPSDRDVCLRILVDNVTVDLNGYMIVRANGDTRYLEGIRTAYDTAGIIIKNGYVLFMNLGILFRSHGFIENVTISCADPSTRWGILASAPPGKVIIIKDSDIRRCQYGIYGIGNILMIEKNNFQDNQFAIYLTQISSYAEVDKNRFVTNGIKVDAPVSGVFIYDNLFFSISSSSFSIDPNAQSNVFFFHSVLRRGCYQNRLSGCAIGGNFWDGYSQGCQNNDKDSFCDNPFRVPGTNLWDYYPLAYPQPYLCQNLQANSVTMQPSETRTIEIYWAWNQLISTPTVTCNPSHSSISCSVDISGCNFNQPTSGCTARLRITTSGTPVGTHQITLETSTAGTGGCDYVETIYVNVQTVPCSGSVTLNVPSNLNISQPYTPTMSGLSNCGGVAYYRQNSCGGPTIRSCYVSGTGCSFGSLNAPSTPGAYTYCACFDKNSDGIFQSDEYDCKTINVGVFRTVSVFVGIYDVRTVYTTGEKYTTGNYLRLSNATAGYDVEIFPYQSADPITGDYIFTNVPADYVYKLEVRRSGFRDHVGFYEVRDGASIGVVLTPEDNGAVYAYGFFPNGSRLPSSARYTIYFENKTMVPSLHPLATNPIYNLGRWLSIPFGRYYVEVEWANYFGKSNVFSLDSDNPLINLTIYTEEQVPTVWIDVNPKNISFGNSTNLTVFVSGLSLPLDLAIKVKDPVVKDFLVCKYETMSERNQTFEIPAVCFRKGNVTQDVKVWACWYGNCFESNTVSVNVFGAEIGLPPIVITPIEGWEGSILSLQAIFFALSIGFSAALEFLTRGKGIVFGVSLVTLILFGSLIGILPKELIYISIVAAGLLFAGLAVRIIGGGV
jgi:hypothetical protein